MLLFDVVMVFRRNVPCWARVFDDEHSFSLLFFLHFYNLRNQWHNLNRNYKDDRYTQKHKFKHMKIPIEKNKHFFQQDENQMVYTINLQRQSF